MTLFVDLRVSYEYFNFYCVTVFCIEIPISSVDFDRMPCFPAAELGSELFACCLKTGIWFRKGLITWAGLFKASLA